MTALCEEQMKISTEDLDLLQYTLVYKEQTVRNTFFSGYASRKAQPIHSLGVCEVHDATERLLQFFNVLRPYSKNVYWLVQKFSILKSSQDWVLPNTNCILLSAE